jgi:hypothetical protein
MKKKRGVKRERPQLKKPKRRPRKIKYPRKRKNITKRQARQAVKTIRKEKQKRGVKQPLKLKRKTDKPKVKPLVKPKVKLKKPAVKINRNLIAKAIKESAVVKVEQTRGDKTYFKEIKLNVSPAFIDEYIDRVLIGIEQNIPVICEKVLEKGRKTLMVKDESGINDVVAFFDTKKNTIVNETAEGKKEVPHEPG